MSVAVPELETERLRLTRWRGRHHDAYAEMCANARTQQYLGGVFNRDDAWRRIAMFVGHWEMRGFGNWALERKADDAFVGYTGLWQPSGWPEPEIMWGLVEAHEGNGYATEGASRACTYAFRELGWPTAVSYIASDNAGSRAVAKRLGATRDGHIELRGASVEVWRHFPNLN